MRNFRPWTGSFNQQSEAKKTDCVGWGRFWGNCKLLIHNPSIMILNKSPQVRYTSIVLAKNRVMLKCTVHAILVLLQPHPPLMRYSIYSQYLNAVLIFSPAVGVVWVCVLAISDKGDLTNIDPSLFSTTSLHSIISHTHTSELREEGLKGG